MRIVVTVGQAPGLRRAPSPPIAPTGVGRPERPPQAEGPPHGMCGSPLFVRLACRLIAFCLVSTFASAQPVDLDAVRRGFEHPPDDARIMMRWWWFGSAVTKPELEREMRRMKEGGIGGFEVQPVYPVALDDPEHGFRNLPYLSDEYLGALRFASQKARELGLRMDVTLGSGWPFGGPHTPITQAAGKLRCDRVAVAANAGSLPMPDIGAGEKLLAIFLARGDPKEFSPEGIERIDSIERGRLRLPSGLSGPHVAMFFIASRTGQQVKRAAVGAEGFVLDHYDRAAIENHLKTVGDRLIEALRSNPPYSVFSDSLEVFASDWTGDLIQEFQKRRGYDLTPYLPALIGDIGEKTADVRRDWGKTLTELCDERYLTPIREWAHKNGTRFRSQTYGTPPVVLSSNALVDLPEGEQPYWRRFTPTRWAASASHLYGRPVTSSETWTWLHSPAFRATPLDMKAEADLHFLQGVNQLIGHGWPYSPDIAGEPGWRFYAAAVFNHHNPWWLVMPDVTRYLQRVSYLLRQGAPANDVAVYLPTEDAYAQFTAGHDTVDRSMDALLGPNLVPQILDAGYNFDFIDDAAMEKVGVLSPVLVLPNLKRMPPETARRIEEYKRNGGIVVDARRTGDTGLGSELTRAFAPDFAARVPAIGFIHRRLPGADLYFIANTGNQPVQATAKVRAKGSRAEWWDPYAGTAKAAKFLGGNIALDLQPYESRVLVISNGPATEVAAEPGEAKRLDIGSGWKVTYQGLGRTVEMNQLRSWTEHEETRYFSGQAAYEKTVTIPHGTRVLLNLGAGTPVTADGRTMGYRALLESPVHEAAVVYVNGKRAGSVWRPPYEVDITPFVRAGENSLRIVVGNLAINALAGQKLPDYKLLNVRYGERFTPQDMNNLQPLPSGLLGPVTLMCTDR
jgi:alpha-L-rhamnosidase